jgi:hypothetical protein
MNISQIKLLTWLCAALLTLGLSLYVFRFVTQLKEKQRPPDGAKIQALIEEIEPPKVKVDEVVTYADIKRLFHEFNWTGRVIEAPVAAGAAPEPQAIEKTSVRDLVHLQMIKVDLGDPKNSSAFIKYKPKSGIQNSGTPPGFLLREGDALASPHDYAKIESITADGVTFVFREEGRDPETLTAEEFDISTAIVQVGPDGVRVPKSRSSIPRGEREPFRPERTTVFGANRYMLGSEDMAYLNENYAQVMARELRTARHQDPRTGKYDGIEIKEVAQGSIAERHGAQAGDVIKSINGHPVTSVNEAITFAKNNADQYTVWEIVVESKGKTKTIIYETPE